MQLYNTLTRQKETLRTERPDRVTLYVCGPTVYNFAHIGNARPAVVFDVLARLLRQAYPCVVYARNFTDVDDKINAAASAAGVPIDTITTRYIDAYHQDMQALGVLSPDLEPRVTGHIPDIIELVATLIERGHAYEAEGHVLFHVASYPDYGQLSGRRPEDMLAGARVEVAPYKRDPLDFVLWKPSTPEQPGWDSPWGRGRPGWHVECSAMIGRHLGHTIDIHGGGQDLIFPHHENEIAQSRCAHGTETMAKYWLHNGYLQVEGRKMSKSEGNFVTIHDLLHTEKFGGRKWPGEVLRLAMLMTHYREPIDFSVRRLEEADTLIDRWASSISGHGIPANPTDAPKNVPSVLVDCLIDDLAFSRALPMLHELARDAKAGSYEAACSIAATADLLGLGRAGWDSLLQRKLFELAADSEFDHQLEAAIDRRLTLLRDKNFAEADRIRDELAAQGIQLMDYKDPETGERRTNWEVKR